VERARLAAAAAAAGLTLDPSTTVTVTGTDPLLASPVRLGEGVATALTLVGQEASRLWEMQGGRPQALSLDLRHALASLSSYALVEAEGLPTFARPGMHVTAIWECGDGRFIHLHGSFTNAPGILAELGLAEDASHDQIAAACLKRGAFELEDALAAKGLCVAVCRTREEWAAHPQGALLATKPVIELTKVGDAPPEPLPAGPRPLSGVRVLDLTRVLAGPTNARTLAEHGADVLHVASPHLPTMARFEIDTGHGKRQAYLDLNQPAEADALRDLIGGADVFSQGFQHRSLERRGFGVESVAALRPGIIYVSENAFGHDGPWQERPGWEQLAQSTTGVAVIQGGAGRPVLAPAAMNDYTTGYLAAVGTMMALRRRALEGGSWSVRVSLSQTSMWYLRLGHDLSPEGAPGLGDLADFMVTTETGYGAVRHLRPPLHMSETPPHWALPTAPLGSHSPTWLPR
jgi:crotonobetainyl-CoA:carnitine CoA-transferase CaiB-like acyl-CoA transferase